MWLRGTTGTVAQPLTDVLVSNDLKSHSDTHLGWGSPQRRIMFLRSAPPKRQKSGSLMPSFSSLLTEVRACVLCAEHLPLGPRPIVQLHPSARILIAGQAPGRKVHETGVPFDDPSGDRLRDWLGISRDVFYDAKQVAILPMGFCFPGTGQSGDLPPRTECAEKWRVACLSKLKALELTLVIGQYALNYHLPSEAASVTAAVQAWRKHWPNTVPLPHPSPRNNLWLKRNPWFEDDLIPVLRARVAQALATEA